VGRTHSLYASSFVSQEKDSHARFLKKGGGKKKRRTPHCAFEKKKENGPAL